MAFPVSMFSILEVRLSGNLAGQFVETTWHYVAAVAFTDGGAAQDMMAADFEAKVWTPIRGGTSVDLTNVRITTQWIYPIRYVARTRSPMQSTGFDTSAALPSGAAIVLRRRSNLSGRKFRGRVFLPGIPYNSTFNSQLTAAWLTANGFNIQTAGVAALESPVGTGNPPVVWSATHPIDRTLIDQAFVDPVVRYQRRREVGVGI